MERFGRRTARALLAVLFALSTVQHGTVEVRPATCAAQASCGGLDPDRLTDAGALGAVVPATSRTGVDTHQPAQHRTGDANTRAGTDALFHQLAKLLLARAQVSHDEFRAASIALHSAAHGTASAPTRAPPIHS